VLGFFFVSLSLYLAIISSVSIQFSSVYPTLFFAYLVVLSAEVGVMLTLWTRGVIQMVKNKRQTPNNKIKSAEKVELRSGIDTNSPSAPVKLVQKKLLGSKLDKRVSAGTGQSVSASQQGGQDKDTNLLLSGNSTARHSSPSNYHDGSLSDFQSMSPLQVHPESSRPQTSLRVESKDQEGPPTVTQSKNLVLKKNNQGIRKMHMQKVYFHSSPIMDSINIKCKFAMANAGSTDNWQYCIEAIISLHLSRNNIIKLQILLP